MPIKNSMSLKELIGDISTEMTLEKEKYSETIDHLLIKKFLYENIPLVNDVKSIRQEIKVGNRIADIYVELKNGKKVAIEIQHSKIAKSKFIERTNDYNINEVHVLWIIDGQGPYNKNPKNEDEVIISVSEKELYSMYRGRVYYINVDYDGIKSPVYALYFTPFFDKKVSSFGFKYYKRSKSKQSIVYSEISSLKLNLFRNKSFKLARFLDENLKNTCITEVVQFLNGYTAYYKEKKNESKNLFPNGLPIGILIKKFQEKYGLYLLFDVLRYLKFLTVRDARYMFEKEHWFQKCILN